MPVERLLPTQEAHDLIDLTRDVADKVLAPIVDEHEKTETFPDGVFPALGRAGLLSLPYPEEFGGGAQPYEVYLQVLEEIAARWAAVAVATSVHSLSCFALATHGTDEQKSKWLPDMLGGETIGAYSLSEPQAGSDAAALSCRATEVDGGFRINAAQAWITNGGRADFYTLFARTSDDGARGISCFLSRRTPRDSASANPRRRWDCAPYRRPPRTTTTRSSRPSGSSARPGRACPSHSAPSIPGVWVSPPSPSAWRRARSTMPSHTPRSARHSASASSTIRARFRPGRHGRRGRLGPRHRTSMPPAGATPDSPTPATRPSSRSSSRRTQMSVATEKRGRTTTIAPSDHVATELRDGRVAGVGESGVAPAGGIDVRGAGRVDAAAMSARTKPSP